MRRIATSLLAATLLVLLSVSSAFAVGLHQHYVDSPGRDDIEIARGICKNQLQNAIDNLHANFHFGSPADAFTTNPISFTAGGCPQP